MISRASQSGGQALDARGHWERRVAALPANVGTLRAGVVAFAGRHGVDANVCGDIALAASEALTNAVMHAFVGRPPGTVRIIADTVDAGLVVRIIDDGRGMMARTDSPGAGMGLSIMALVTSDLDIHANTDGPGTEVRLSFAAGTTTPSAVGAAARSDAR